VPNPGQAGKGLSSIGAIESIARKQCNINIFAAWSFDKVLVGQTPQHVGRSNRILRQKKIRLLCLRNKRRGEQKKTQRAPAEHMSSRANMLTPAHAIIQPFVTHERSGHPNRSQAKIDADDCVFGFYRSRKPVTVGNALG
jgi:hypothetical protein